MALADQIKKLISSPKGRQAMERGRRELSKPENQKKIRDLMGKVNKRR